jgi:hypothetical protein
MKTLSWILALIGGILFLLLNNPVYAAGEKKEICTEVAVKNKNGAVTGTKTKCKTVKVHKKLDGKKIPDDKKKKK